MTKRSGHFKIFQARQYQSVILKTDQTVKEEPIKQAKAKLNQAELEALGMM